MLFTLTVILSLSTGGFVERQWSDIATIEKCLQLGHIQETAMRHEFRPYDGKFTVSCFRSKK